METPKILQYGVNLPFTFVPNVGQTDAQVCFLGQGHDCGICCTRQGFVLKAIEQGRSAATELAQGFWPEGHSPPVLRVPEPYPGVTLELSFVDPDPALEVHGEHRGTGLAHYFRGQDPRHWRTDVPTFAAVVYQHVWPGIDCRLRGNDRYLLLEWIVHPGAAVDRIRWTCQGAELVTDSVADDGNSHVTVHTALGTWALQNLGSYQVVGGQQFHCGSHLRTTTDRAGVPTISLGTASTYDPALPLFIVTGPILGHSTYLGGAGADSGAGAAVDSAGNVYVTGYTISPDFPTTPGAFQGAPQGGRDAFVAKLDPEGKLLFSTYLGGSGVDYGTGIAVDGSAGIYVTGVTTSADFPVKNAFQPTYRGGGDAFVTKLDSTGSDLIFSTYLGGAAADNGNGIAVDGAGSVYVTGGTDSSDFPVTPGAFQVTYRGFTDAFVTKFHPSGSSLSFSTYLGGTDGDTALGIAVDGAATPYVTGYTFSPDFPVTAGAFQPVRRGLYDAFVTKLTPTGSALAYSSYLGGTGAQYADGIAVDPSGHAYLTGYTTSPDFPTTPGAFQTTYAGAADAFITKMALTGTALVYSTYLGGTGTDSGTAITIDEVGHAYVTGETSSPDFPLKNAFQPAYGGGIRDAYVAQFGPAGSSLGYSSYLGGSGYDVGTGIAVDRAGRLYVTGITYSTDFPVTPGAFQPTSAGPPDAFVVQVLPPGTTVGAELVRVTCIETDRKALADGRPDLVASTLLVAVTVAYTLTGPTGLLLRQFAAPYSFSKTIAIHSPEGTAVQCELLPSSKVIAAVLIGRQIYTTVNLCLGIATTSPVHLLLPVLSPCTDRPCLPLPSPRTKQGDVFPREIACILTTLVIDWCVQSHLLEFSVPIP